jgi:hypothetical protein
VSHPLVLALYLTPSAAASGTRALHELGIAREQISVVARSHDEQGALAAALDATPGADLEDSRPAALLGELGGLVLAAIAIAMPGIGPIVAAGPLSAGLGEAAGHAAGGIASVLTSAGVPEARANALQRAVQGGAVLIGVHTPSGSELAVREVITRTGASDVEIANWSTD